MTEHLIDFVAIAAIPTNEQRIVAAVETIVALLTPKAEATQTQAPKTPETAVEHAAKIAALQAKVPAARRK